MLTNVNTVIGRFSSSRGATLQTKWRTIYPNLRKHTQTHACTHTHTHAHTCLPAYIHQRGTNAVVIEQTKNDLFASALEKLAETRMRQTNRWAKTAHTPSYSNGGRPVDITLKFNRAER